MKIIAITLLLFFVANTTKKYHKAYYKNGKLKEKGWIVNQNKTGYWFFYYKNGQLQSEGHFEENLKNKWWIFYNQSGQVTHKCQLKDNIKNGYCLMYSNNKIKSAQKYKDGKKTKEWFNFNSFKAENNISNLQ